MQRGEDGPPAAPAGVAVLAPADWPGSRLVAAALGLTLAGILSPLAAAVVAATGPPLWSPLVASALVALLVLAPAGIGVAATLVGLRRIALLAAQAGHEAEQAVIRVLIVALLFGYALALGPLDGPAADCVALVAPWLVAAWAMLLYVLLRPAAPKLRRNAASVADIVLLSWFLHLGGPEVSGWYPLYLVTTFYSGLRFGVGALAAAAAFSMLGFAAVVLMTAMWHELPFLAAGLLGALAVLPAFVARAIRAAAAAHAETAQAKAERRRALLLIADVLRGAPAPARSPVQDLLDLAALETGTFAPALETFELRALVRHVLAPLRTTAAERQGALRWRVDPRLPDRLRGHAQVVARILRALADRALEAAPGATISIALDAGARDMQRIALHIRVDGPAAEPDSEPSPGGVPLAVRLVERLLPLVDGAFTIEPLPGRRTRLAVALPLAIEAGAPGLMLDLQRRPVLIITDDDELARELAEPLAAWNAEPSWTGDTDEALGELATPRDTTRPIAIVDGRVRLLSALGLAHRAACLGAGAPFVLLIVPEVQIASLADLDAGELDGFIPAPVTEHLLANALHGLPLEPGRTTARPADPEPERQTPSAIPVQPDGERITAIAAHPRFVPEPAAAVDPRAIETLRSLGGGPVFVREVIETFLADAPQIMERIEEAVAAADPARFVRGLLALHRTAGHLGGAQLCELALSLRSLTASELRQQGAAHVQRLASEIDRLAVALLEFVPAAEVRRP